MLEIIHALIRLTWPAEGMLQCRQDLTWLAGRVRDALGLGSRHLWLLWLARLHRCMPPKQKWSGGLRDDLLTLWPRLALTAIRRKAGPNNQGGECQTTYQPM